MNVLVYLVPLALLLGLTGLAGFMWTLKSGQYDDLDGAAVRILADDDIFQNPPPSSRSKPAGDASPETLQYRHP